MKTTEELTAELKLEEHTCPKCQAFPCACERGHVRTDAYSLDELRGLLARSVKTVYTEKNDSACSLGRFVCPCCDKSGSKVLHFFSAPKVGSGINGVNGAVCWDCARAAGFDLPLSRDDLERDLAAALEELATERAARVRTEEEVRYVMKLLSELFHGMDEGAPIEALARKIKARLEKAEAERDAAINAMLRAEKARDAARVERHAAVMALNDTALFYDEAGVLIDRMKVLAAIDAAKVKGER